jgi:uncharacterized membrane protein (UPF0127 family)
MALLFLIPAFSQGAAQAQETFLTEPLAIESPSGKSQKFTVELALDNGQRAQGLMYRKTMEQDHGMLFDFGVVRDVTMWMRNTHLPLDMIFIDRTGTVSHIHENAVPFSDAVIGSGGPVKFVLEVNAGIARKLDIRVGDHVRSAQIKKSN